MRSPYVLNNNDDPMNWESSSFTEENSEEKRTELNDSTPENPNGDGLPFLFTPTTFVISGSADSDNGVCTPGLGETVGKISAGKINKVDIRSKSCPQNFAALPQNTDEESDSEESVDENAQKSNLSSISTHSKVQPVSSLILSDSTSMCAPGCRGSTCFCARLLWHLGIGMVEPPTLALLAFARSIVLSSSTVTLFLFTPVSFYLIFSSLHQMRTSWKKDTFQFIQAGMVAALVASAITMTLWEKIGHVASFSFPFLSSVLHVAAGPICFMLSIAIQIGADAGRLVFHALAKDELNLEQQKTASHRTQAWEAFVRLIGNSATLAMLIGVYILHFSTPLMFITGGIAVLYAALDRLWRALSPSTHACFTHYVKNKIHNVGNYFGAFFTTQDLKPGGVVVSFSPTPTRTPQL